MKPPSCLLSAALLIASMLSGSAATLLPRWPDVTNVVSGMLTNHAVLYVRSHGDDATARAGNPAYPWRSVTNAIQLMTNGSVLDIGPGVFYLTPTNRLDSDDTAYRNNSPFQINDMTNVAIRGSGPATRIVLNDLGFGLVLNNVSNFLVSDLVFQAPKHIELTNETDYISTIMMEGKNGHGVFRNVTIDGSPQHGLTHLDGARVSHNIRVESCIFIETGCTNHAGGSIIDGTAVAGIGPNWEILNCRFKDNVRDIELESINFNTPQYGIVFQGNNHEGSLQYAYMVWPNAAAGQTRNIRILDNCISNMVGGVSVTSGRTAIQIDGGDDIIVSRNIIDTVITPVAIGGGKSYGITARGQRSLARNIQITDNILRCIERYAITVDDATYGITNAIVRANQIIDMDPVGWTATRAIDISGVNVLVEGNLFFNASKAGQLIFVNTSSDNIGIVANIQHHNYASTARPTHGIHIAANVTNYWYEGNQFTHYISRPITNNSPATGLPCRQVWTNAPSGTLDPAPPGSTFINSAGAAGAVFHVMEGTTWTAK